MCHGKNNKEWCEFVELRQEKEIWVKEKKKRGMTKQHGNHNSHHKTLHAEEEVR
jgi:hypothetical protein